MTTAMNRFFTCTDLIAEYRLPQHVYNQLFAEVVPVEKTDHGETMYLEAHVDAWLERRDQAHEGRDGVSFLEGPGRESVMQQKRFYVRVRPW